MREAVVQQQLTEIGQMKVGIEEIKSEAELAVRSVEAASIVRNMELKHTV